MKPFLWLLLGLLAGFLLGWMLAPTDPAPAPRAPSPGPVETGAAPEIHSKHFLFGYPTGTPATNDLIVRDVYALSSNDATKFADWVAYRLDAATIGGTAEQGRQWRPDPWLDDRETLEPADYRGAYGRLDVDRGHQAPLASFRGNLAWPETNFLSNITPQKSALNQGPWRLLEERVRDLVGPYDEVFVVTGPLYERDLPGLPEADEPHRLPSGYWKVVAVQDGRAPTDLRVAAFVFEQETERSAPILDHLASVDEVERRSGLDFFSALPDDVEATLEATPDADWAQTHFD